MDQVHVYFSGTDGYGAPGSEGDFAPCMRLTGKAEAPQLRAWTYIYV